MPTSTPALLARLVALAEGQGGASHLCLTARREHAVRSTVIDRSTLAIVLEGCKSLRSADVDLELAPGAMFVMTRGCRLDAVNRPDLASGRYRTLLVALCDEVLAAARLLWAGPMPRTAGPDVVATHAADFAQELGTWAEALELGRTGAARLAIVALLIRLCEQGHAGLLLPPPASVAMQIRALVAAEPAREWRSPDFEQTLNLSGATLRRRLAAERTSLGATVAEARLGCAITLLYTTSWPIKTVAARVGYRSVASFARRFIARYGLEPGAIGNAAPPARPADPVRLSDSRSGLSESARSTE
ncbi:helix-turn-helix transcriptional regulator [Derxia lacustris]|uniref:helix-turn-helix transcriptional regulator n=1 Tax=Derxia lacustris TaxID=764842 RepID=UPI000A175240|nr:AraC family transcriptional regulator [Derxia lacustris]